MQESIGQSLVQVVAVLKDGLVAVLTNASNNYPLLTFLILCGVFVFCFFLYMARAVLMYFMKMRLLSSPETAKALERSVAVEAKLEEARGRKRIFGPKK